MKSTVSRAVRLGELIPLYICRCLLQPQTLLSSFSQHFFPETVTTVQLQHNLPGGAGGGGYFLIKGSCGDVPLNGVAFLRLD